PIFGYGSSVDYNDASLEVAGFDQGGLAMPSRDYYLSTDAKMTAIRDKFVAHVQKMFELSGETAAQAKTDASTVLRLETAMAKAQMDVVKRRDPANLNNR